MSTRPARSSAMRPEADFSWVTVGYPAGACAVSDSSGVDRGRRHQPDDCEARGGDVRRADCPVHVVAHEPAQRARRRSREPRVRHGRQVRRSAQWSCHAALAGPGLTRFMTAPLKIAKGRKKKSGPFARIEDAIEAFRAGEIIIVCDDEDRENEGDLTLAAEKVTPKAINFMAKYGRGPHLHADDGRAARRARDSADGESEHRAARHGVLRDDRSEALDEHRHLGRRSLEHGACRHRSADQAVGSRAARPHVSAARATGRRARPRRADRGGRRSGAHRAACIPPASSAKS